MPTEPRPSAAADGHADAGARAQLEALAREGGSAFARDIPPAVPGSRAAAVLILFGVLDDLPSDRAASAAVVSRDLDVLLLSRATTLRSHPGQVAFPGGRVDAGDADPVAAALREAQEETGLDPSGVDVLGTLAEIPLDYSRHLVTPVLGWWRRPSPVRVVDIAESADVFRAPVADLLDPAHRGVTVIRRDGQEWRGPAFLLPARARRTDGPDEAAAPAEHLVWGFTGIVLDTLFTRLGWTEAWDDSREFPLEP